MGIRTSLIVLILILFSSGPASSSEFKFSVVGTEPLCISLATLYNGFYSSYVSDIDKSDDIYRSYGWEDFNSEEFNNIGLKRPISLIKDDDVEHTHTGHEALYRVHVLDGIDFTNIYVQDRPMGIRGGLATRIWLLRYDDRLVQNDVNSPPTNSEILVGLLLPDFGRLIQPKPDYKYISGPYRHFSSNGLESLGTGEVIQRVFLYKEQALIIARQIGRSSILVYRLDKSLKMNEVCWLQLLAP